MALWWQENSEEHKSKYNPNKLKLYSLPAYFLQCPSWTRNWEDRTFVTWLHFYSSQLRPASTCRNGLNGGLVGAMPAHLHVWLWRLPMSNPPPLLCLDEDCTPLRSLAQGSTAGGRPEGEGRATFRLAPSDLDFAPPKGAGRLLSAGPVRAASWARSPPHGRTRVSSAPTLGGSSHPCRPLGCLGFLWPPARTVPCMKAEVLNRPPSLIAHPD